MDSSVSPKMKSGFCACAITFQTRSTTFYLKHVNMQYFNCVCFAGTRNVVHVVMQKTRFAVSENKAFSTMTKCKKVKENVLYLTENGHKVGRNI